METRRGSILNAFIFAVAPSVMGFNNGWPHLCQDSNRGGSITNRDYSRGGAIIARVRSGVRLHLYLDFMRAG
eukprot:9479931-Pyramimonas_sp.AAC.1